VIDLVKPRARNLPALVDQMRPYLRESIEYDPAAVDKHWSDHGETRARLAALRDRFAALGEAWDAAGLEEALRGLADELGVGAGKLIHPLRVALVGSAVSPGIFDVLVVMGRERTLRRMDAAITLLGDQAADVAGPPDERPGAPS